MGELAGVFGAAVITAEQLATLTSVITDNTTVLIPAGLTLMGIMLGISLIPRVIYKFF